MLLIASLGKDVFERRMSSGSGLLVFLVKANVLSQLCRQIVSTRVKALSKTDLVSLSHIKRKKESLPVDVLKVREQRRF